MSKIKRFNRPKVKKVRTVRKVRRAKSKSGVGVPAFLSKALKKGKKVAKRVFKDTKAQAGPIAASVVKDLLDTSPKEPLPASNGDVNYAKFAAASYKDERRIPKNIAPGYELVKYWSRASVYVNRAKREVVFSSRGTVPSDPVDIITDGWIVKSKERQAPEYGELKKQFNLIVGMFPGYSIVLTGHSKGGRLVIDIGEDFPGKGIKKVYAFAPGSSIGHKQKYQNEPTYRSYIDSKVISRRVKGDPISVLAENALKVRGKVAGNPHSMKNFL